MYMNNIMQAYIKKYSFKKDEIIDLFISGNDDMCEINITDLSNNKIFFSSECKVYQQKTPILSFAEGCNWKVSFKIHLEKLNLEPDLYIIRCKQDDDNIFYIPFVLLNTDKKKDIAVVVNTNTWNAYTEYGEGSFYWINGAGNAGFIDERSNCIYNKTDDGQHSKDVPDSSAVVSFNRPFTRVHVDIQCLFKEKDFRSNEHKLHSHLFYGETHLWLWLKKHNFDFDFVTDQDVENYDLFKDRKIIMLNCHPEYWSHKMYYNLLKSLDEYNTNIIYLGGNGIWRKIYFNEEKNRIEKMGRPYYGNVVNNYKNLFSEDEFAKNNPIDVPPFAILGVGYWGPHEPFEFKDFKCTDNNHWIFENTDLKIGDIVGKINDGGPPAGNENDFFTGNSLLDEETKNKYFKNIKILGKSLHDKQFGEIVMQKYKNSSIFSCGSIPFTRCINDPQVTIMIKNVIKKFIKN